LHETLSVESLDILPVDPLTLGRGTGG